eukprot:9460377-Pyramimonas_sp.AAC.1
MVAWSAWGAMRCQLKEPVVLVECSDRLKPEVLDSILGHLYVITYDILDPTRFGWVGRRPRFYAMLILKDSLMTQYCDMTLMASFFSRQCDISWRDLMLSTDKEKEDEIKWALSRPTSISKGKEVEEVLAMANPFLATLTTFENGVLRDYQGVRPGGCYVLSQRPQFFNTSSDSDSPLHGITANPGLHWSDRDSRWLTKREVLLMQGFPVYSHLVSPKYIRSEPVHACSFADDRYRVDADRSRRAL